MSRRRQNFNPSVDVIPSLHLLKLLPSLIMSQSSIDDHLTQVQKYPDHPDQPPSSFLAWLSKMYEAFTARISQGLKVPAGIKFPTEIVPIHVFVTAAQKGESVVEPSMLLGHELNSRLEEWIRANTPHPPAVSLITVRSQSDWVEIEHRAHRRVPYHNDYAMLLVTSTTMRSMPSSLRPFVSSVHFYKPGGTPGPEQQRMINWLGLQYGPHAQFDTRDLFPEAGSGLLSFSHQHCHPALVDSRLTWFDMCQYATISDIRGQGAGAGAGVMDTTILHPVDIFDLHQFLPEHVTTLPGVITSGKPDVKQQAATMEVKRDQPVASGGQATPPTTLLSPTLHPKWTEVEQANLVRCLRIFTTRPIITLAEPPGAAAAAAPGLIHQASQPPLARCLDMAAATTNLLWDWMCVLQNEFQYNIRLEPLKAPSSTPPPSASSSSSSSPSGATTCRAIVLTPQSTSHPTAPEFRVEFP